MAESTIYVLGNRGKVRTPEHIEKLREAGKRSAEKGWATRRANQAAKEVA